MKADWENGNAYTFQVITTERNPNLHIVSNGKYKVLISSLPEANIVAKIMNAIQVGNGDGISREVLLNELSSMEDDYLDHDYVTLSEKVLVSQIFRDIKELL